MVRGKKNFLPPTQLEMGLAVLFRLGDEESIARHQNERRDFALMAMNDEELSSDNEKVIIYETSKASKNKQAEENDLPEAELTEKPLEPPIETVEEHDANGGGTAEDEAAEPVEEKASTGSGVETKKGLSARDRRLIKKYGSLDEAERVVAARLLDDVNGSVSVSAAAVATAQAQEQVSRRGKKAKLKRAKKKYAEQDDEDRELAMLLLQGSTKSKGKDKSKQKSSEPSKTQQLVASETSAV